MRIVIDANVFISALNYPNGVVGKALDKAMKSEEELLLCDFVVDEVRENIQKKFPDRVSVMEGFFDANIGSFKTITVPDAETEDEGRIRDENDRPILRAAVAAGADIIITGDRDFLEAGIWNPKVISAADYLSTDNLMDLFIRFRGTPEEIFSEEAKINAARLRRAIARRERSEGSEGSWTA